MGWLRFEATAEESFETEKLCRVIRNTNDPETLREVAEQCYRGWVMQARLAAQLMEQIAQLEAVELRQQQQQGPQRRRRGPLAWFGVG